MSKERIKKQNIWWFEEYLIPQIIYIWQIVSSIRLEWLALNNLQQLQLGKKNH